MPSILAWRSRDHEIVIAAVIGDVARPVVLQSADAVLEAGCPRHGELPGQRLRVAGVGREILLPGQAGVDGGQVVDIGDTPRFRAVRDRAVGKQQHRRAVGQRDPGRLDGGLETIRWRGRGQDGDRGLPLRPNIACNRSMFGLVGQPIDDGRRCTSTTTNRSSSYHRGR